MKSDNLHNLYGLSRELNLPVKWLKAKAVKGQIPCLKIGRRFRFNIEAVKAALLEMAAEEGDSDE
jgi:hypothetical protein